MSLTSIKLQNLLLELVNDYRKSHPERGPKMFKVGGGKHKYDINNLEIRANKLNSANVQTVITDLETIFTLASEAYYRAQIVVSDDTFIDKLNKEPDDHQFYRGIGLILKAHYNNANEMYNDIQNPAEIKAQKMQPK